MISSMLALCILSWGARTSSGRGRSSSARRHSVCISARDGGEMRGNTLLDEREVGSAFVADGQHRSSEALKVNGEF